MSDLPTITVTAAGAQPTPPATLNAELIATATALAPGLTILPAGLIEDLSSTATGALVQIDQAAVDAINNVTPFGANVFVLNQQAGIYGVPQGETTNTSVFIVFTGSSSQAGFVIAEGFTVSDGTHQYTAADGGVILSGGNSQPLFFVATQPGAWVVPENSVTQIITALPAGIAFTISNPEAGNPSPAPQTVAQYRAAVLMAGLAASQGMPRYLKTLLGIVPGVQARLVSIQQQIGGWLIIVGGSADPYEVGYAIYRALFDVTNLKQSAVTVAGITNANPAMVTTNLSYALATGTTVTLTDVVGMTEVNGVPYTLTVMDDFHFSLNVDSTSFTPYVSGGVVSPNPRNEVVTLQDYPDTYTVPFVIPPQQTVVVAITWNTTATNFVSATAVAQLGAPAVSAYVNGIFAGQPINLFELEAVFGAAIASVLPPQLLTRIVVVVAIDGVDVAPTAGTGIIQGDTQSFLFCSSTGVTVTQG